MKTHRPISIRTVKQKTACLLSLAFICLHWGFSQDDLPSIKESLYVQTDRDLYISGEQVWVKVYKLDADDNTPYNGSKVVYLELLNQAGYPVTQLKLHVPHKSGSTSFILSDTLSSGNYLLRAHTSWMRNYPEEDFSFRTLSVVNPFRSVENIRVKDTVTRVEYMDPTSLNQEDNGLHLELIIDETGKGTRERVQVSVQARDSSGNPVKADLSASVARSVLVNDQRGSIFKPAQIAGGAEVTVASPYLPEMEGIVLSGTLLNSLTDMPIENEDLALAIVGKTARCQFYRTDDRGKFHFNLNETGIQEIVIQALDSAVADYYIELESDFHQSYDHPPPGPLFLDTTKLQELNQAIISMQIRKKYDPYLLPGPSHSPDSPAYDFYAEPEFSIQISDYIPLKTIREVIKEIVPMVRIRTKGGKYFILLENEAGRRLFENSPLVLVDGVPFDDMEQILNMSLSELERMEVIDLRYFMDGQVFEGIIHFVTYEGKMAGLEVGHEVFRQAYPAFSEGSGFSGPVYTNDALKRSALPDFRNTLYWNPHLHTGEDGNTSFEFYTSDESGDYTVFVEGISPWGKTGYSIKKLVVF